MLTADPLSLWSYCFLYSCLWASVTPQRRLPEFWQNTEEVGSSYHDSRRGVHRSDHIFLCEMPKEVTKSSLLPSGYKGLIFYRIRTQILWLHNANGCKGLNRIRHLLNLCSLNTQKQILSSYLMICYWKC